MSFAATFPRRKPYTDNPPVTLTPSASYSPLDTLDLDHSISAVGGNLFLNCKSCKSLISGKECEGMEKYVEKEIFTGFLGVISKGGVFSIYQLQFNERRDFSSKLCQTLQIQPNQPNSQNKPVIFAGGWVPLRKWGKELTVLVLVGDFGTKIYSEGTTTSPLALICSYHGEALNHCRTVGATRSQIIVGNRAGELHFFSLMLSDQGPSGLTVQFTRTDNVQSEPISVLVARRLILATGSPSGTIRIWRLSQSLKGVKEVSFKTPTEECITCLKLWEGCLIASYGSGILRIFDIARRTLLVRISAHSRWIVGLDLLAREGLLLTYSEDENVFIWRLGIKPTIKRKGKVHWGKNKKSLNKVPKIDIKLESTIIAENMLLVGGKFISCCGSVVALTNYGAREVYLYSKEQGQDIKGS